MKTNCYFVTGAAGFVGRHLCQRLRTAGHRVLGLVRRPDASLDEMGVEVIVGDLGNTGAWQDAVAGADYVVHCAANASFASGSTEAAINVEGTRHLLEAAQRAGASLQRFVLVSTIGAVDRPPGDDCTRPLDENSPLAPASAYGRSKRDAEQLVRQSGLPCCIVRPAMVVGRDMRLDSHFSAFIRLALRRALFARLAWPGEFSVVDVDDLAAALEICAGHPDAAGRTFFCAGAPLSIRAAFDLARPATRLPLGWAAALARVLPRLTPFKLKALLLPALVANDSALRQLGWSPRQAPADALRDVIQRERARLDPAQDPGGQTVITGAASGLGRALLERLGPSRQHLLLVDRDRAALEEAGKKYPRARLAVVDLADDDALAQLIRSDAWCNPPVSEIYACAGIGLRGPMLDSPAAKHVTLFKVNVLARLVLAHAALPGMIRARFGRIIFISSSSAFQPLPYLASYSASCAAVLLLGEAWAAELAGTGVQTLQVCPGGMQTNFHRTAGVRVIAAETLMTPEEAAGRIMRALARKRVTIIISIRAIGMSLVARLLPRAVSVALWKKLMEMLR